MSTSAPCSASSAAPSARPLRVLISGAGIAGPVLSYWLTRSSGGLIRPVLVEKAPSLRTSGQHLDIHGAARPIVDRMGLTEVIRGRCTLERGTRVVDARGKVRAEFPVGELEAGVAEAPGEKGKMGKVEKSGISPTNELEILRYELAKVFFEATEKTTDYRFGEWITAIDQAAEGELGPETTVTFASGRQEAFDVVVIADGMTSPTRSLVFGQPNPSPDRSDVRLRSLGFHIAYFPVPWSDSFDSWANLYWTAGRRVIWLRPDWQNRDMRVYLISRETERFAGYRQLDEAGQKALWREHYQGADWNTDEILRGMERHTGQGDWYMQEVAQVVAPQWSKGRVVLLGDAAYCPSPMSGMGTSGAITGAYVLGCELGRLAASSSAQGSGATYDPTSAFEAYERVIRPYMEEAQNVYPSLLKFLSPNSETGVKTLLTAAGVVGYLAKTRLGKWAGSGEDKGIKVEIPQYEC